MDDLISRQAAIDAMGERPLVWDEWADEYELGQRNQYDSDKLAVETVPSAEPERHWIPTSERLPEEKKDVLIAFKHNMAVGFWEDVLDNGEPAWYANSGDGWMTGTTTVDSDGIPIAWMPLPEPPKMEGEQE